MGEIKNFISKTRKLAWEHKKISIVASVIFVIAIIALWPKSAKQILTQKVSKGDVVKMVSVTGKISSDKYVDLTFPMGGMLVYLGVKKGDTVKAYQTIATLDQRSVQKNIQITLASYAQARNSFDATEQGYSDTKSQQATNDQMRRILENNQYDLNKAVASVELQDLIRQQSILTSPIAGIVTRTDVLTTGVNVTPATVFSVTDPTSMTFSMDVDEADIGNIKIGQNVDISLDAFPNDTLKLKISQIDFVSHLTSSGGTAFTVKATLPFNNNYRIGMNGNADIVTDIKRNVLNIPLSSVMEDNTVYVKTAKGYEKRKISLGLQSDILAQVKSGISLGDTVAVDPSSVPQQSIRKK